MSRYRVLPNVVEETRRLDKEREASDLPCVGLSDTLGEYIGQEGEGEIDEDGDVRILLPDRQRWFFYASTVEVVK